MSDKNARYEGDWYYCWLIERCDGPQPRWLGEYAWETDANKAIWYSRKADADAAQRHQLGGVPNIFVCEHGFALPIDQRSLLAARPSPDTAAHGSGAERMVSAEDAQSWIDAAVRPLQQNYRDALEREGKLRKLYEDCKALLESALAASPDTAALVKALRDLDDEDRLGCNNSSSEYPEGVCKCVGCNARALLRAHAASMTPIDTKGEEFSQLNDKADKT